VDLNLTSRVAIVTGGSKGIGRAAALRLVEEGASVLICARNRDSLDETVRLAKPAGEAQIDSIEADLTRIEDIKRVVERCVARFGGIDILVNNAGSARTGDFRELSDQAWQDDWMLKFFGYVRAAREAFPHMSGRRGAVVVNVIGAAALRPSANYMIGGAINAALNNFTKSLAAEGARHGIRVAGINPGPILTERLTTMFPKGADPEALKKMTPLGRPGKPEEVADLIAFLASDRAAFIHAANITIDGGSNPGLMG
jgi:NAD(P)-dependent dehydrogenase (short-subunit alcohol dehydrogenase family)